MKTLFVVNPVAGGGRCERVWGRLAASSASFEGDAVLTQKAGDAEILASRHRADGYDAVVAVGGDGTLHEVVNGAVASGETPTIGVVPCGTGNDFARSLGLPRKPEEALRVCLKGATAPIDIGKLNDRYFINVAGFGFDAAVAQEVSRRAKRAGKSSQGALPYVTAVLRIIRTYRPRALTIRVDGETTRPLVMFGAVGNGSTYGGGMRICPLAVVDDGTFDLCLAFDMSIPRTLFNLVRVFRGSHLRDSKVTYGRGKRIEVSGDPDVLVHADGQLIGSLPVTFEILPAAVRFLVPKDASP